MASFDPCFKFTIGHEGAWGNIASDRGNWTTGKIGVGVNKGTKYGIAAHAYPDLDIRNLTLDQAKEIYQRDYWAKVAGRELPAGVDLCVWDMSVNAGVGRGLALLRAALGTSSGAAKTLAGLAQATKDKVALIKAYSVKRMSFYQGLSTFKTFGRGWTRRAADCEVTAVKLALSAGGDVTKAEAKDVFKKAEAEAKAKAKKNATGAVATGTGGAVAAPSTPDVTTIDWTAIAVIGAAGLAAIALLAFFIWWTKNHNARAKAYAAAAETALGV